MARKKIVIPQEIFEKIKQNFDRGDSFKKLGETFTDYPESCIYRAIKEAGIKRSGKVKREEKIPEVNLAKYIPETTAAKSEIPVPATETTPIDAPTAALESNPAHAPIEETTEQTATQEQAQDSPSVEEKPRETTDDLI